MKVQNEAVINVQLDPQVLIKKYEKEIKDLRQELAMHDTLSNRGRITYEPYTPELQYQQQTLAKKFFDGELEDIEIESLRQVKELFYQMRNIFRNVSKDLKNFSSAENAKEGFQKDRPPSIVKKATNGKPVEQVGVEDNKFGFGLGKALKEAKPTAVIGSSIQAPKNDSLK